MADQDTLYARWLSNELSAEEISSLQASGELAQLEAIIKTSDDFTLPPYKKEEAFEALKARRKSTPVKRINFTYLSRIAAALLVLVGAYFLLRPGHITVSASFAENLTHRLEDNSIITLNDGSSITYDMKNWGKERKVTLVGEAHFQVEKGSPFTVETKTGIVRVMGTSFNVRAWDRNFYVECYSGSVLVKHGDQEAVLSQAQTVNIANGSMKPEQTINHQKPLWSTGTSKFYEESLNNVFDEIERQYNVKVETELHERIFSGVFIHDNLETALEQICKPMGLTFNINSNQSIVTISN